MAKKEKKQVSDISVLKKELQRLLLEHAQYKLKNTSSISLTRKKIAQALTAKNMARKEEQSA